MDEIVKQIYERRLSGEEANEKFIFITKDVLNRFPSLDTKFNLEFEDETYEAVIVAVPCDCIGTWHEHYHLKSAELFEKIGFKKGTQITLHEIDRGDYLLKTKA